MTQDSKDLLTRFYRALVREINAASPEALTTPFSVAEIYQNLVPYRTHRDEIGVEMNGDYEHALLRLLAGEGDFLTIESRTARQEIREELEAPNPNTALYRDFAAADVLLNPDKVDEALAAIEAESETHGGEAGEGGPAEAQKPLVVEAVGASIAEDPGSLFTEGAEDEGPEEVVEEAESAAGPSEEPATPASEASEGPDTPDPEAIEGSGEPPPEPDASEEMDESAEGAEGVHGEEWKDPSNWMEPSLEELKRQYEENRRERMSQEAQEAVPEPDELASEGLPFEVSVETESGIETDDSPGADEPLEENEAVEAVESKAPESCAWCREKLPERPGVNFCPFCGMSVKLVPCPDCGEELELNWRFCIACGTEVSS